MSTQQPCHLPQICSQSLAIAGQTWTIYYSQQDDIIFNHPLLRNQLVHSLETKANGSFRQQIHLQTIPFLMAVNDSTQKVSLLSPRGHRELFLLTHLNYDHLTPSDQDLYQELAQHVARAKALESTNFPGPIDHLTARGELASLADPPWATLQVDVATLSQQLDQQVKNYRPKLFESLSGYGLHLIANYDLLRVHLLKFVAVLSALDFDRSGQEVKRLLRESLHRLGKDHQRARQQKLTGTRRPLPPLLAGLWRGGLFLAHLLPAKFWGLTIRPIVRKMAQRFITGETIEQAQPKLLALLASGRDATLDQLGELVVSAQEADTYCQEILKLILNQQSFVSPGTQNRAHINRAHISLKLSALCHDFNPYAFDSTYTQVAGRLTTILETAAKHQVFINIDAEHYRYRDTAFAIYRKLLLTNKQLKNYQQTGIVVQSYLRDAADHLQEVIELAQKRGLTMPIRLVKGAYWDAETIEAQAHGYDAPEFLNKEETDIHYRQLMIAVLKNFPHLQLCVGSHNLEDHCYSEVLRELHFPHTPPIEHQCLHMTYEALSQAMAQHGLVVRNYVPVGPLLVGMSYLVRRIMENSSQVGILAQVRSRKALGPRPSPWERWQDKKSRGAVVQDPGSSLCGEFFNIPPVRLYRKIERDAFIRAGEQLAQKLPQQPGVALPTGDGQCPLGHITFASPQQADQAIARSAQAFVQSPWPQLPPAHRASYLLAAGQELLLQRLELAQLISLEAGKTAEEALGDVDEAVDFLHFYAQMAVQANQCVPSLKPRGPVAVISPWNFPLAICCGMTAGALATGHPVVLKSAEQTPWIAQRLVDIFQRVGLPPDVLIHLPGPGETVGNKLVTSPQIAQVVFTGSLAVGMEIIEKCAHKLYHNPRERHRYPTKVIAEMGGKNAIIITANAELDETVIGLLYSAYAHAGQKCSACSRIIVDQRVAERVLQRFSQASQDIAVGKASARQTYINPLISAQQKQQMLKLFPAMLAEVEQFGGTVHVNRLQDKFPKNCIGPLVLELPPSRSTAQDSFWQRELFAPVVHVMRYHSLVQAVELFNSTPYALTGGIYSQSQNDIDFLSQRMRCGNIYINRPNTGARVGIEPFGGFKLSGTGPKAGSTDYLRAFLIDVPNNNEITLSPAPSDTTSPQKAGPLSLSRPTHLPWPRRIHTLRRGLKLFIQQWGNTPHFPQEQKSHVLKLYQWMSKMSKENWRPLLDQRPNITIPGQLSYSEFSQSKEQVCLIAKNLAFNPKVFYSFIGALIAGSGVTIISQSSHAIKFWSKLVHCLLKAGFPRTSLHCSQLSPAEFNQVLGHPQIAAYIADSDLESLQKWVQLFHPLHSLHVKKFFHPSDSPCLEDFEHFVRQFSETRAFAINTVRYGAPLALDF